MHLMDFAHLVVADLARLCGWRGLGLLITDEGARGLGEMAGRGRLKAALTRLWCWKSWPEKCAEVEGNDARYCGAGGSSDGRIVDEAADVVTIGRVENDGRTSAVDTRELVG